MTKKHILFPVVKETKYNEDGESYVIKGSLLGVYYSSAVFDWEENKVFDDTLTYIDYGRGRSSVTFEFKGTNGATYPMFLTDMSNLLHNKDIAKGKVRGAWTFVKRGNNYGIKLVDNT